MANTNILYGWDVSPYTSKVETYFNYKNIPFKKIAPNALTLANKIQPKVGKVIMPVVFDSEGGVQQDSTLIIDHYETLYPQSPVIPVTPRHAIISRILELHADDWLPMAALHYRWNYKDNLAFILKEFGKSALPYFPRFIQTMAAKKAGGQMSGYLLMLGVTPKTQLALEANTEKLMGDLDKHFSNYSFVLGERATLGDFSLYGPLYAHLHRDPYPVNLVAKHKNLMAWIDRMGSENPPVQGDLVSDDQIPETLLPILNAIGQFHMPLIQASFDGLNRWAESHEIGDKVPGKLGDVEINIEGVKESRFNLAFPYWKFQRMSDLYQGFSAEQKQQVETVVEGISGFSLLKQPLNYRVKMHKCRLFLVS